MYKATIPALSLCDVRLHPTDRDVLGALCFFVDDKTQVASPRRNSIAAFLGIHESKVSQATKRLELFGWILKEGSGKGVRYFINWSNEPDETLAKLARVEAVDNLTTLADSGRVESDATDSTGSTLADSGRVRTGATGSTLPESGRVESDATDSTGSTLADSGRDRTDATGSTLADSGRVGVQKTNQSTTIRTDSDSESDSEGSELIRSDLKSKPLTFNFAVKLLRTAGCPYSYNNPQSNANGAPVIRSWIDRGITVEDLSSAIQAAKDSPTRRQHLGPRYVDGCLETILADKSAPAAQQRIPSLTDLTGLDNYARELGISTRGKDAYQVRQAIINKINNTTGAA